jgi:hypothetical protein
MSTNGYADYGALGTTVSGWLSGCRFSMAGSGRRAGPKHSTKCVEFSFGKKI